jgi:uncharacterized protein
MPMFPLGGVLLPGAVLPLHVFEPRYRTLVHDCLAAPEPEFGVVMIERGSEVGGGDLRSMIGTVARMMQVAQLDDGRFAIVCVGTRRIRVREWLPDAPYPRAEVDDWPDEWHPEQPSCAALHEPVAAMKVRLRRACALATELGDSVMNVVDDMSDDPLIASYQLATIAPIGPADMYSLLSAAGPAERLLRLDDVMDDLEAQLQFRLGAADDESRDGHGDH